MGVISLKFGTEDFSSLCVNDYVYYMDSGTFRNYNIATTEAKLLGPVKQINKSIPLLVRSFDLDRDHYTQFTINNGSVDNNVGHDMLNTGHDISHLGAIDPDLETFLFQGGANHGNIAKKGDIVTFAAGQGSLSSLTRTISGFVNFGGNLHYKLNDNITSAGVNFSNVEFTTTSPHRNKILISDTTGISQGMFVKGVSLPGGNTPTTIVSNVVEDVSITLSNLAITGGASTQLLTFSHDNTVTAKPFEVLIHVANNDVTLPVHSNNPYYFFVKDTSVNTSGLLGYYADVKLSNNSLTKAELFSIGSEVFESSK